MTEAQIIGKGTWLDKVARKVIDRELELKRDTSMIRVESGLGASGIPHIGNLSDVIRAYGIQLALQNQGYKSEHIAYIDDMDGLRRVPQGIKDSARLERYLAFPVSRIPDTYSCHSSYGEHVGALLRDAMDRVGVEYIFERASVNYKNGRLLEQSRKILKSSQQIGRAIKEITGQEKYEETLPYFAVCQSCGRIYTTQALSFDESTDSVSYKCVGVQLKGKWHEGCGYEGEVKLSQGEGKLSWKVEFAARWSALDIRYEAHGKELLTSVKVNDWVSDNILGFAHPYHVKYELLLSKGGKKLSKSEGNLITPETWFRYGSPKSLVLLMFKRIVGTRVISVEDIPKYMDEVDRLEDVYFGRIKVQPESKAVKMKGLYEYVSFMKPPAKPQVHVPYMLLAELGRIAPPDSPVEYVLKKLEGYRMIQAGERSPELIERIQMARNWALEVKGETPEVKIEEVQRKALLELVERIKTSASAEQVQNAIFETAKSHSIPASDFFSLLYLILLGTDRGPRLGPYIFDLGKERVVKILLSHIDAA
ncbi:MAG: lysine--tRNA ligase [Conexivisphaerales archaeon]